MANVMDDRFLRIYVCRGVRTRGKGDCKKNEIEEESERVKRREEGKSGGRKEDRERKKSMEGQAKEDTEEYSRRERNGEER